MVYLRLEHAQVMYVWRGPFNDMADCLLEAGTCLGHVCMERILNDIADSLIGVGTCSGHVYMERPFQ